MDQQYQSSTNISYSALFLIKKIFIPHIQYLKDKCNKTLKLLRIIAHKDWGADQHTLLKLYRTLILFTNPSARAGYDTRSIFKRSLTGLNSEFSFLTSRLTKAEEPSLPYYLSIARGRIIGFIPFPRVLVLCEM